MLIAQIIEKGKREDGRATQGPAGKQSLTTDERAGNAATVKQSLTVAVEDRRPPTAEESSVVWSEPRPARMFAA
jgi:hypothetical protein